MLTAFIVVIPQHSSILGPSRHIPMNENVVSFHQLETRYLNTLIVKMQPSSEETTPTSQNHVGQLPAQRIPWRPAVNEDRRALLAVTDFGPDLLRLLGFSEDERAEIAIVEVATELIGGLTKYHAFVRLQHENTAVSREVHLDVQNNRLISVLRLGSAGAEIDALMAQLN